MKKKLLTGLILSLICILSMSGICHAKTLSGPDGDVEIELPDDFYTYYSGDGEDNELSRELGIPYQELEELTSRDFIYAIGVTEDDEYEAALRITEAYSYIGSPSDYSVDELDKIVEIVNRIFEDRGITNASTSKDSDGFIKTEYDFEGKHCISYTTFSKKYIYMLNMSYSYITNATQAASYMENIKASLVIPPCGSSFIKPHKWDMAQWVVILIFITAAGNLLLSFLTRFAIIKKQLGSRTAFILGLVFAAAMFSVTLIFSSSFGARLKINPCWGNIFFIWLNALVLTASKKTESEDESENGTDN